ncbi:MAG: PQQ-binding-like beta-propeller repeat protein [Anaerolineae bacterium]|nr:PQQ-binding-like beta-propeller repeat protein [Anaerolineae bacterium]
MNQRDLANRFSSDVDNLLRENGLSEPKPDSAEYKAALDLAHKLVAADFSQQSKIRHSLRRRLLSRFDSSPVTTAEIPGPWGRIKQLLKPGQNPFRPFHAKFGRSTLAGLVLVGGLIILLGLPGLPLRQKMMEMLAQVLLYLPVEREVSPHLLTPRWQFRGEGGISTSPVAAGGLIYAGSNNGDLYALDAHTGQEVWRFKTGGEISLAPAVSEAMVYVVSDDGFLYALDRRSGLELWRTQKDSRFSFGPVLNAGLVLVGAEDGSLYALEAETAQEKWQFKAGNVILPQATVAGETLYVGSQDHFLYALDVETGREKWRFDAGNWLSSPPVEVAGMVYVGSHSENLYVLDAATGRELRRYPLGLAVRTSATLAEGVIYFGSYDGYLHAVEGTTGEEKWRFSLGKQTRSAPLVVGGIVYIGSGDGYLYEIEARTGLEIAHYGIDSQIYTTPAALDETIYFVSGKGDLYAVQKTPVSPADTPPETRNLSAGESPGFQFTPGGWYVVGQAEAVHFRGRIVDGAGQPVNGVSIQADNGSLQRLSAPSGPNRWQSSAQAGQWEIALPPEQAKTGWWWLTVVRDDCVAGGAEFEPQCQDVTRLSESVKVEVVYPAEMVINADWTCQWDCRNPGVKK